VSIKAQKIIISIIALVVIAVAVFMLFKWRTDETDTPVREQNEIR